MKLLRVLLLIAVVIAAGGCSLFRGKQKSHVHMYEGDTSPAIKLYDEGPGSELHN